MPFSEIVRWDALYECPAASCALLSQLALSTATPQQYPGSVGCSATAVLVRPKPWENDGKTMGNIVKT